MIKIQVHNDGKEKYDSYEARLKYDNEFLVCYGQETAEEAIEELKGKVEERIKELQNIDWTKFDWIAWDGCILNDV